MRWKITTKPKELLFDIETLPNQVYSWGVGKQFVSYDNIKRERQIACICYKWRGEAKVHTLSLDWDKYDVSQRADKSDLAMLKAFSEVYNQADVAIGHNAIGFDKAVIRSRLVYHGLPDIAPVIIDDTYLQSTPIGFTSHKLDYLSQYLGLGHKADHPYSLWKEVSCGSAGALIKMASYCRQDVLLLEKVYDKLKPYIKSKMNLAAFNNDSRICPSCGENRLVIDSRRKRVNLGIKINYRCTACGKFSSSGPVKVKGALSKEIPR